MVVFPTARFGVLLAWIGSFVLDGVIVCSVSDIIEVRSMIGFCFFFLPHNFAVSGAVGRCSSLLARLVSISSLGKIYFVWRCVVDVDCECFVYSWTWCASGC
jgi:hypothetical protein